MGGGEGGDGGDRVGGSEGGDGGDREGVDGIIHNTPNNVSTCTVSANIQVV